VAATCSLVSIRCQASTSLSPSREACQLLNVDRGVPEVFGSIYDIRKLIKSTVFLRDREKLRVPSFATRYIEKTIIGQMLEEYGLI
jgi:oleate hydratase